MTSLQVHIHWLNSHEITGTVGQASMASIILRGLPSHGRDVVLFCSHWDIQLEPSRLHLPAAAQVEVKLQFKPSTTGLCNVVMNVVDSMTGSLVDVILIRTHARTPHVSRVFEVDVPIGTIVNKKVCQTVHSVYAILGIVIRDLLLCLLSGRAQLGSPCRRWGTETCTISSASSS